RYVVQDYINTAQAASIKTFWHGDIYSAIQAVFPDFERTDEVVDLDRLFKKETVGLANQKPRHVFLIIME
ncbi:MAG: hypothetical protein GWN00_30290, partial [Aliifodinibius sp.]|nr:hypothetical protein [Phycisphaerae bacterium]NIR66524.1 hypothetical protein [candidate division Zixibacteria bacterium]NIT60340.1 hypothetical protein [Fodinibius sp.]NIU16207.1 hypothetical protein [candidate division Zixibacteria bacterium]NIV15075.1 hypothetical protein [Fodinibius sp.]